MTDLMEQFPVNERLRAFIGTSVFSFSYFSLQKGRFWIFFSVQNGFFKKKFKKNSKKLRLLSVIYKKNEKNFQKTFGGKEKVFTFALPIENERVTNRKRKVKEKVL
jgi:hypothetical protein